MKYQQSFLQKHDILTRENNMLSSYAERSLLLNWLDEKYF